MISRQAKVDAIAQAYRQEQERNRLINNKLRRRDYEENQRHLNRVLEKHKKD